MNIYITSVVHRGLSIFKRIIGVNKSYYPGMAVKLEDVDMAWSLLVEQE